MMPISPPSICLSQDQQVKQQVAVKQMKDLMTKVNQWVKYRLLGPHDRISLLRQGYARDLVDNLVYITLREGKQLSDSTSDALVTGFTEGAFDPSLYACENIRDALQSANGGRCCWCESLISHNDAVISHYRPPSGYQDGLYLQRDAYYSLAYDPGNLMYSCKNCAARHKANQFPVSGCGHMPKTSQCAENPVLLNPYSDNPRQYLRFNPVNAKAYAYDTVLKFYQESQGKGLNDIDTLLFNNPSAIPQQTDVRGIPISDPTVNNQYQNWLCQCNGKLQGMSKGQGSIDILGLNRPTLVRARAHHLKLMRGLYISTFNQDPAFSGDVSYLSQMLDNLRKGSSANTNASPQYLSMTIDAVETWSTHDKVADPKSPGVPS